MAEKQSVACTVMARDTDGDYVFLVEDHPKGFSFLNTVIRHDQTGLASIIEKIKKELAINVADLELFDLTNAVVEQIRIPLFVFSCRDESLHYSQVLADDSPLTWQHSRSLTDTLKKWEISGVPQFQKE